MIKGTVGIDVNDTLGDRRKEGKGLILAVSVPKMTMNQMRIIGELMGETEDLWPAIDWLPLAADENGFDPNIALPRAQELARSMRAISRPTILVGRACARLMSLRVLQPLFRSRIGRSEVTQLPAPLLSTWWDSRVHWQQAQHRLGKILQTEQARWAKC